MKLSGLWTRIAGTGRRLTSVELFTKASRCRNEGRFEEAARLVAAGRALEPKSVVGHLLAAHLHLVFREVAAAKETFEQVLALDRTQPRALLGLARLAFEEGDVARCRELLRRALDRYPDFPEAQALLDAVPETLAPPEAPSLAPALEPASFSVPARSLDTLLLCDDAVLFASPPEAETLDGHTSRMARLAGAVLQRAGCGALGGAVVEGPAQRTRLRCERGLIVVVTFPLDEEERRAEAELDSLWAAASAAAPAGDRR